MNTFRIVVVAGEVLDAEPLLEIAAGRAAEVFVVAPALNTPIRHWCSDDRKARTEAEHRLQATLSCLRDAGVEADGWVGDAHPLTALADVLATRPADQVVVATVPAERANWLAQGLAERARTHFELPVAELVVDIQAPATPAVATRRVALPAMTRRPALGAA